MLDAVGPHLMLLRSHGSRPPLVLVPGQSGYAFIFRSMPGALGDEQPVLALQLLGVNPNEPLTEYSIEQMAAVFVPQIIAACPHGPIVLGGYSMGALLAFELAHRLQIQGRDVPLLVSFDGFAPQYHRRPIAFCDRVRAHAGALLAGPRAYLSERRTDVWRRALKQLGREWELAPGLPSADRDSDERAKKLAVLRERAAARYRPSAAVSLSMLVVRAERPEVRLGTRIDARYGWTPYVDGSVSTITVRGTHRSLLDSAENQHAIARSIVSHMDDTRSRSIGKRNC